MRFHNGPWPHPRAGLGGLVAGNELAPSQPRTGVGEGAWGLEPGLAQQARNKGKRSRLLSQVGLLSACIVRYRKMTANKKISVYEALLGQGRSAGASSLKLDALELWRQMPNGQPGRGGGGGGR